MHGLRVAERMWADLRTSEARHRGRRTTEVFQQDVASAVASQSGAASILKERLSVIGSASVLAEESANETGRLGQEWTEPFATTFPADADVRRGVEMKVARREIEDLLNASARVVQHGEQDVIAFAVDSGAVHLREKVSELLLAQVSKKGADGLLARH